MSRILFGICGVVNYLAMVYNDFEYLETDENASEDSKSDANLSEYEERIRRNRELPQEPEDSKTPLVNIPAKPSTKPKSPVLSPRNASPYLDEGDYGIEMEFPDIADPSELLMTKELISKVIALTWLSLTL